MLSRSKLYVKKDPDKDARLFIIFSEGERTEPNYFKYFNGIASQIKIEWVPLMDGKNSPGGLYETACKILLPGSDIASKYDLHEGDEVWFVIDTDEWGEAIAGLRDQVSHHAGWFVAQSNPCFEVWLCYHFQAIHPVFADIAVAKNWKKYLSETYGGFNCFKHPIHVEAAIANAKANFSGAVGFPELASTEVYILAERILPLVKSELDQAFSVALPG